MSDESRGSGRLEIALCTNGTIRFVGFLVAQLTKTLPTTIIKNIYRTLETSEQLKAKLAGPARFYYYKTNSAKHKTKTIKGISLSVSLRLSLSRRDCRLSHLQQI